MILLSFRVKGAHMGLITIAAQMPRLADKREPLLKSRRQRSCVYPFLGSCTTQ